MRLRRLRALRAGLPVGGFGGGLPVGGFGGGPPGTAPAGSQAGSDGDDEQPGDDHQREGGADPRHGQRAEVVHPRSAQRLADELDPDERQDGGQARRQIDEPAEQPADQEVQVAQAQQGEQVRGEDQEGVRGQPEDRRDGIEREQHIGHPDRDDQDQQRGGVPSPVHPRGEAATLTVGRDRQEMARHPDGGTVPCVPGPAAAERHPGGDIEQERAEQVLHPAEPLQGRAAEPDQHTAKHEREKNPQQQNAAVVLPWDPGTGDQQDEDHEVVQRQAVLGQPSGEELAGRHTAAGGGDQRTEGHSRRDRRQRPHRRLGQARRLAPPGAEDEIGAQKNAEDRDRRGPGPEGDVEDMHDLSGQAPVRAPGVPSSAGRTGWIG
jgi:hypothetical protein